MSEQGAFFPHTSFNVNRIEGQLNTINLDSPEGVISHFNSELEQYKVLLYGSHIKLITTSDSPNFDSSQTFSVDNSVDAIGDIHIEIQFDSSEAADIEIGEFALHRTIDRVEFKIGTSIIQTLEHTDIYSLLFTKLNAIKYSSIRSISNPANGQTNYSADIAPVLKPGLNLIAFPIPLFTMADPSRAHLITGATDEAVTIDITYRRPKELESKPGVTLSNVKLYTRQYILTDAERDEIRRNIFSKILHFSESTFLHAAPRLQDSTSASVDNFEVSLSTFKLFTSHLLITMESQNGDAFVETTNDINPSIIEARLLLKKDFSSSPESHSSILTGHYMRNLSFISMDLNNNSEFSNTFLVSGDPPTGFKEFRRDVYIFPIASKPYGNDGCPLNNFEDIKLLLKIVNFPGRVNVTGVGLRNLLYSNGNISVT